MELLWDFTLSWDSHVLPWDPYGNSMRNPWDSHGASHFPWDFRDAPMGLPRDSHGTSVVFPWDSHGTSYFS